MEKLNFFISGFRHGFYLGYQGPRESCFVKNSDSTKDNGEVVNTKLKKEMKMGRIAGPFIMPPFKKIRVSPLAVIPKSTPGEYRLIHNLSAPLGDSVISFIPPELTSVKYQKLEDAINIIKQLGRGTLMSKMDIKDAFRLISRNNVLGRIYYSILVRRTLWLVSANTTLTQFWPTVGDAGLGSSQHCFNASCFLGCVQ